MISDSNTYMGSRDYDINENINPIEAGLKWVVDLNKKNFIGKKSISNYYVNHPDKKLVCFKMLVL